MVDARRRVERLLQVIAAAVDRQSIAEFVEDYVIFEIESFGEPVDVKGFYLSRAQQLAQILRAEQLLRSPSALSRARSSLAYLADMSRDSLRGFEIPERRHGNSGCGAIARHMRR